MPISLWLNMAEPQLKGHETARDGDEIVMDINRSHTDSRCVCVCVCEIRYVTRIIFY